MPSRLLTCEPSHCPRGRELFSWLNAVVSSSNRQWTGLVCWHNITDWYSLLKVIDVDYTACVPNNCRHNLFRLCLDNVKHSIGVVTRLYYLSIVSKRTTHPVVSFKLKWSPVPPVCDRPTHLGFQNVRRQSCWCEIKLSAFLPLRLMLQSLHSIYNAYP